MRLSGARAEQIPDALRRRGHLEHLDPERAQRVGDRAQHRRGRADRAALAEPFALVTDASLVVSRCTISIGGISAQVGGR